MSKINVTSIFWILISQQLEWTTYKNKTGKVGVPFENQVII